MDTFYVAVALCLVAGVSTQPDPLPTRIFYDIGTAIQEVVPPSSPTTVVSGSSDDRRVCSIGSTVYHTDGSNIFQDGTLLRAGSGVIHALACCCNFIATAYTDSDGDTFVNVQEVDSDAITISLSLGQQGDVALEFFKHDGDTYLLVLSRTTLYKYDVDDLKAGPVFLETDFELFSAPRCLASYWDAVNDLIYSFVSFNSQLGGQLIVFNCTQIVQMPAFYSVFIREAAFSSITGLISCVDIEDEYVYFVVSENGGSGSSELAAYPITQFVPNILAPSRESVSTFDTNFGAIPMGSSATGLSVCGSSCPEPCDAVCECESSSCGLCFDGGDGSCQCANSLIECCIYNNPTQNDDCAVREPRINACCMVKNPVALRRSGDDISVVGVTSIDGEITVDRLARTGRWRKLPIRSTISATPSGITIEGFSASVQSTARGRRFGAYYAEFVPSSGQREWIPCIATESSGFLNAKFTVTVSQDEAATLQATFVSGLVRFMSSLRWYYSVGKDYETPPTSISSCNGKLICNLPAPVQEGVYEVFRQRRYLRTWHPIFYVFVRDCNDGFYGPDCLGSCPDCECGVCDDVTGLCNCAPGFTGTLCDEPCAMPGFVGNECDIACGGVFEGHGDCAEMLICNPGKTGCRCYPGLQAPYCRDPCEEGFWGPDCMKVCETETCDPRTGVSTA